MPGMEGYKVLDIDLEAVHINFEYGLVNRAGSNLFGPAAGRKRYKDKSSPKEQKESFHGGRIVIGPQYS